MLEKKYFFDPETGDILGEKPTFAQAALQLGIDFFPKVNPYDYANELHEIMKAEQEKSPGRI